MTNYLKFSVLIISFLMTCSSYSQLSKYNFDDYDFSSNESLEAMKEDVLSVANLLLNEPVTKESKVRLDAGFFLNEWMKNTEDYSFGSGNLSHLYDEKEELMIISMAAQVKYCLENGKNDSYEYESRLEIWKIMIKYIENPKNNVKLTRNLKQLIKAKDENDLAKFLSDNE